MSRLIDPETSVIDVVTGLAANPGLGTVSVAPADPIVVGTFGTWTLTYTVGTYGIDVGGGLKIGMRRMADWGVPQFDDPGAPDHVTVSCSSSSRFVVRYDPRGHIRPFRSVIIVDVAETVLYPGDTISIVIGDTAHGSPGMKAQTFPETVCEFAVFVDPMSSGEYRRVPQVSPNVAVVPAPPECFDLLAPSTVTAGAPFRVLVRSLDRFGNATPTEAMLGLSGAGDPVPITMVEEDGGATWVDGISVPETGVKRLELTREGKVIGISNPLVIREEGEGDKDWNIFWGDTQGQTANTVGAGSVEEYFRYARDVAGIDYCTHQGHDFMLTDEDWAEVTEQTRRFHEPSRFVTFLGYEWSPTTGAGGDRNVMYLDDTGPLYRCNAWQVGGAVTDTEKATTEDIFSAFHDLIREKGSRVLMQPHVGGRRADVDVHDPDLEPLIEISSCHGVFEWRLLEALERGYHVGVVSASDDCTCRPGFTFPTTAEMCMPGGLGAMLARTLTRDSLWQAMSSRRCYGTTGARIVLDVAVDGHPMGSRIRAGGPPKLTGTVHGTAALDEIAIFDRTDLIHLEHPNPPLRDGRRLRILWSGARTKDRSRHTVWDGELRIVDGRILSAAPLCIPSAKHEITEEGPDRVAWKTVTAGQESGILLVIEAPDEARIFFDAGPATFDFPLGEARRKDIEVHCGGVGQKVRLTTLHHEGGCLDADFTFTHERADRGERAYWVRVKQADFHRAWSSPIYVEMEAT